MRTIRLIAEDAASRRPIVQNAKSETIRPFKKSAAKVLIKPGGGSKFVVEPMHENCDVTLFLVFCRIVRGEFIRGRNQKLLKIGPGKLSPILDVRQRRLIADPVGHAGGIDVRADSPLAAIIDHPIPWHFGQASEQGGLSKSRPKDWP